MSDTSDALGWVVAFISVMVLLALPVLLIMSVLPPIAAFFVFIFMGIIVLIGFAVLTRPE
jgi:hypothetical protein